MAKKDKPYGPTDRILVRHKETAAQYGVNAKVFEEGDWQARGFEAVSLEDGTPFKLDEAEEASAEQSAEAEEAAAAAE